MDALRVAGAMHDFEESKREYIGQHGDAPVLLVQGPPGTGKSYATAFALFARIQGAMSADRDSRAFLCCRTHAATDVLLRNVLHVQGVLRELRSRYPDIFATYFDERMLSVELFRADPKEAPPDGVITLYKKEEREKGGRKNIDDILAQRWCVVATTPGGTYRMLNEQYKSLFGHEVCDCLILDEASQMNLPEAMMAALPLKLDGQLLVVGDHRQMPPIVKHDWSTELRRTFKEYRAYESLFLWLLGLQPPMIKFEESFRLHADMTEFLRREVYVHDGINFHSRQRRELPLSPSPRSIRGGSALSPAQHRHRRPRRGSKPQAQSLRAGADRAGSPGASRSRLPGTRLRAWPGGGCAAPCPASGPSGGRPRPRSDRPSHRTVCTFRRRYGGALPGRRARCHPGERHGERPTVRVACQRIPARSSTPDGCPEPRKAKDGLGRVALCLLGLQPGRGDDHKLPEWKALLRATCTVPLWEGQRYGHNVEVFGNPVTLDEP